MITRNKRTRTILYLGVVVFLVFSLAPYYWVLKSSIVPTIDAIAVETSFIPELSKVTLDPYLAINRQFNFMTYFWNSVIVSAGATLIAVTFAIPGAYAFARLDFPGRKYLFYTTVFTLMFPWIMLTVPVYEIFYTLDLLDTKIGLIIALSIFVQPLSIWLLQGFFRTGVPENIEEAARIDGTSELGAFFRIVLPLSMPAIGATVLFAFLNAWNNFLWIFVLTSSDSQRTITVAIHQLVGGGFLKQWSALLAGVVILVLPPVVFYGFLQEYVGEGLGGQY